MKKMNLIPPCEVPRTEWRPSHIGERKKRRTSPSPLVEEIERERGRLARELHAGAGQPLAAIKINLEVLDRWCSTASRSVPEDVKQAVLRLHGLTDAALEQIRALSHRLHPPAWQSLPLEEALGALVRESGVVERCTTVLELDPLRLAPSHALRVALYRCAQECISNVIRHSEATWFGLRLTSDGALIHLTVRDNGHGIRADARRRGGIGLTSMEEQAQAAGGTSRISSTLDGTTIQISLPFFEDN